MSQAGGKTTGRLFVKVMCISQQVNCKVKITIDGQTIQQLDHFEYLCSIISEDGYCQKEIKSRIAMGKKAFMNSKNC